MRWGPLRVEIPTLVLRATRAQLNQLINNKHKELFIMNELIQLLRTFGSLTITPKGLTVFNPTNVDLQAVTALATPLGFTVRHQQPKAGEQYYDKASNTMKNSEHLLQVGKATEVTDDKAIAHLQSL